MKTPLKLAVVSDMHVGSGARARDLSTQVSDVHVDDNYRQRFLDFVKREKIRADFLVLPGDVSHRAQPEEIQLASEVVAEIAEALGVPMERCVFVPGNHDVDWEVLKLTDHTGFRKQQRYAPIMHPEWLFQSMLSAGKPHLLEGNHLTVWEFDEMIVVGLNTSAHDDPNIAEHYGYVPSDAIKELEKILPSLDLKPHRLRVCLVHHHPILYSDPIPEEPDFSAMINAPELLNRLRKFEFDLVVHGHRHCPNVTTQTVDSQFALVMLSAGSFSARLHSKWAGKVGNQFHLITVEGRSAEDEYIHGCVESWSFTSADGWLPSERHTGIAHKSPFGAHVQPVKLRRELEPLIREALARKDFVKWSTLSARVPKFKYLAAEILIKALDELATIVGYVRHGHPPDEVILLKEESNDA